MFFSCVALYAFVGLFYLVVELKHAEPVPPKRLVCYTVGENAIATTKIRNDYGAIQSFKFPIFR